MVVTSHWTPHAYRNGWSRHGSPSQCRIQRTIPVLCRTSRWHLFWQQAKVKGISNTEPLLNLNKRGVTGITTVNGSLWVVTVCPLTKLLQRVGDVAHTYVMAFSDGQNSRTKYFQKLAVNITVNLLCGSYQLLKVFTPSIINVSGEMNVSLALHNLTGSVHQSKESQSWDHSAFTSVSTRQKGQGIFIHFIKTWSQWLLWRCIQSNIPVGSEPKKLLPDLPLLLSRSTPTNMQEHIVYNSLWHVLHLGALCLCHVSIAGAKRWNN